MVAIVTAHVRVYVKFTTTIGPWASECWETKVFR